MDEHFIGKWYKEEFGEIFSIFGEHLTRMKMSFSSQGFYNFEPNCVYEDGEELCFEINDDYYRMVYYVHYENGKPVLYAENSNYTEKQRVIHPKELTIQGVALKVIKDIV